MNDTYINWKLWDENQFGRCTRSDHRYFTWCIDQAGLPSSPKQVLEIGFGNGSFLGYCRERGWLAAGIETNAALLDRAHSAGFATYSNLNDLNEEDCFDLIAAFDVLEHVPADAADTMLASMRSHLSPQGAVLLRVPNGDSPFGRAYQHGDRTHLEAYGSEKLRQLCIAAGLRIVHAGEAPWFAQQGQPRTLRTFIRWVVQKGLDRMLGFAYFGYRVDFSPNLFVVIKR